MVNLKEKPYYLNEEQIRWVEDTIAGMTTEEKIGQLFVNMVSNGEERKPENIKKILDTYHPGNPLPQCTKRGIVGDGRLPAKDDKNPASDCIEL